jgi:hypothetical protein
MRNRRQEPLDRICQRLQRPRARRQISIELDSHQLGNTAGPVDDTE